MWLKTENFSNACGTATLKSLPSRSFFTPHVHPRLRKCPPRCTLDCGFKTPESPALRGFVAERCPIRGTSLYLVLKSNGLHRPENLPVKFGFSSKSVPANSGKKLPPQCCSKLLLIPFFNFSHKWPTFAFAGESGIHSALLKEPYTMAHTAKQGPSGRGRYHYPRHVLHVYEHPRAGCQNGVLCRFGILAGRCSRRTQKAFGTAMRLCVSLSRGVAAPLGCVIQ